MIRRAYRNLVLSLAVAGLVGLASVGLPDGDVARAMGAALPSDLSWLYRVRDELAPTPSDLGFIFK